jgi:hypothetical protein
MPRRALLLAAYLLGLLCFVEVATRLALAIPPVFQRIAGPDDASWRLRWVRRHAAGGWQYSELDDFSATRGWALRSGLRRVPAFGHLLSSNAKGLRGEREYAYDRTPGAPRIVVLGDSFTFGEEVGDEETYSRRLEVLLPGVEVPNLGVHGYGHDQMLLYLREEGVRYRPDVVLLGFIREDMDRNLLRFRDFAKPYFVLEDGRLVLRGTPVAAPEEVLRSELLRSRTSDVLTMLGQRLRRRSGAEQEAKLRLTRAILDAMRETIESAGARALYVYLPEGAEIGRADPARHADARFFADYCRERGVDCLDLDPFFRERARRGEPLKTEGHWGAREHDLAAGWIAAHLKAQGALR